MPEQTGKSKALRVRLDYYRRGGWLYRFRWIAAITALLISGIYGMIVLLGVWFPPRQTSQMSWINRAARHVSTGPLASAHAHFEDQCQLCHAERFWHSIASDAFQWDRQANLTHIAQACQQCHSAASHLGGRGTTACLQIDQNCAICHQEHQGRESDLSAVASSNCMQCHTDLAKFTSSEPGISTHVDEFSVASHAVEGSSQFRSLLHDPGSIKFDHAQHLNPGQVEENTRGGFQYTMLTDRWKKFYQADEDGLVQLNCSNCHQLQAPSGPLPPSAAQNLNSATESELARFYAPIDYDRHCAACHQLTFAGQSNDMLPLPHAAPRAEVAQLLSAKIVGGRVRGDIRTRTALATERDDEELSHGQLAEEELEQAVSAVFARCEQCHLAADVTEAAIQDRLSGELPEPLIPNRWLQRGLFDHGTHRSISNCQFCHQIESDHRSESPPSDHETVMIRGPESCVPCHRASDAPSPIDLSTESLRLTVLGQATQPTKASSECVLCHRYHWSRPLDQPTEMALSHQEQP